MPRNYSIRVTKNPDGLISKATISAPSDGIKIIIQLIDEDLDINLKWNELEVVATVPAGYVRGYMLSAEGFKEVFAKPYKATYETLTILDDVLFAVREHLNKLEATEGLSNVPVKVAMSTNDEDEVSKATFTAQGYPVTIKIEREDDLAHVSFEWEDVKISVTAPYIPYFHTLFSERVITTLFTNLYETIRGVTADLASAIHDYADKAKDLAHAKEYPLGWW